MSYPDEHICDHGFDIKHNYGLGKLLHGPYVTYKKIENPEKIYSINIINVEEVYNGNIDEILNLIKDKNLISQNVFAIFETGHLVLSIDSSSYPCFISFSLLTEGNVDIELILDHLSAPSIKDDGFGMIDWSYNINYIKKEKFTPLVAFNTKTNNKEKQKDRMKDLFCVNCNNKAEFWDIVKFKTVPVCTIHKNETSSKPMFFYGAI